MTCLRDQRSIAASNGTSMEDMPPAEMREPPPGENTKPFCTEGEQIGESFCDWIGTEIITRFSQNEWKGLNQRQYQNGIANIWRSACQPGMGLTNNPTGGPHPPSGLRLTKLILPHPYIRTRLGCGPLNESRDIYCNPATYERTQQPAEMYDDSSGEYEETER